MSSQWRPTLAALLFFCLLDCGGNNGLRQAWAQAPGFTGDRWAVVIGVSTYTDPALRPLKYAHRDAEQFGKFLKSKGGGAFEKDNILMLINEKVTASTVRDALGTFLEKAKPEDYVVVFIAGHGLPDPGDGRRFYFMPHDAKLARLASTAVPMDEIHSWIERIKSERVVVFVDACHSGAMASSGAARAGGNSVHRYLNELAKSYTGKVIMTSSSAYELSNESDRWGGGHGVFTYHLLQGLGADSAAADKDGDGFVDLEEAYKYVTLRVHRDTNEEQFPFMTGDLRLRIPLAVVVKKDESDPGADVALALPAVQTQEREPVDERMWIWVRESKDPVDYETFIERFPRSVYAPFAKSRLDGLRETQTSSARSAAAVIEPVEAWYVAVKRGFAREAPRPDAKTVAAIGIGDEFYVAGRQEYLETYYLLVERDLARIGYVYADTLVPVDGSGADSGSGETPVASNGGARTEPDIEWPGFLHTADLPTSRVADCMLQNGQVLKLAPETCANIHAAIEILSAAALDLPKSQVIDCRVQSGRTIRLAVETCREINGTPMKNRSEN